MTCVVKDCKNQRRLLQLGKHISFHRFPRKDSSLFNKWLENLNLGPKNWKLTLYVCSNHFNNEDIIVTQSGAKTVHKLKVNAVPSLNPIKASTSGDVTAVMQCNQDFTKPVGTPPRKKIKFALEYDQLPVESRRKKSGWSSSDSTSGESRGNLSPQKKMRRLQRNKTGWTSDSSGSVKRKRFIIKNEHSYVASPTQVKKKNLELKSKLRVEKLKTWRANCKIKRMKKRISSLHEIVKDLKFQNVMSAPGIEFLEKTIEGVPQAFMKRMIRNANLKSTAKYGEELKKFAMTLHFFNAKAYDYVRNTFNLALPHPSVIRKWCNVIDCNPGFTKECFDVLKLKNEEKKLVVSLTLDEMAIKKQIDFDGKRNWGYIDIGFPISNDSVAYASEALVLMVVCHNSSWKLPIGYFLIKALNGHEKANIVKEALIRLHEINVEVTSVTCDGPAAHFSMFKELGCNFDPNNIKTYFMHPADNNKKVYAIFDACHMLKLVRNCFGDLKTIKDPNNCDIKWEYIEKLHNIQEKETLHLANKLGKKHMEWRRHKMRVKIAAQTLSNSNAEALLFLKDDLKLDEFRECEATIKFLKVFNDLFDLLNSRLPWAKNLKGPLRPETSHVWRPFMHDTLDYIINLKDVGGRNLYQTLKKTPFLGFIIDLHSLMGIYEDYVETKKLNYILTYKCSQDHLELFFCAVRSRNGWNNNPSALQFMRTYRKLILNANVEGKGGNCQVLDLTSVLSVNNTVLKKKSLIEEIPFSIEHVPLVEHDYFRPFDNIELSDISENIVTYISGYVVKMMMSKTRCKDCLDFLINFDGELDNSLLFNRRNLGTYYKPSKVVCRICQTTEKFIRKLLYIHDNDLSGDTIVIDIISQVSKQFIDKLEILFPHHHQHSFNLLKLIIYCYIKIRLNNLAKKSTEKIQGENIRQKLNKLILFKHQ